MDRSSAAVKPGGDPASIAETSVAFVTDTAVFGATGPILGTRRRFEVASTFGTLSSIRLLLDERRYLMPVKPYTLAARILHVGEYGRDSDDPRLEADWLRSGPHEGNLEQIRREA